MDDRRLPTATRGAVWLLVAPQVAYPVFFLGVALLAGFHPAATGVVFIAIPLMSTVMIGVVGWLAGRVVDGGLVAGVLLAVWLGLLASWWWSYATERDYRPNPTQQWIGGAFAGANMLATGAAVYLTWRAWGIRRARRAEGRVDPWGN